MTACVNRKHTKKVAAVVTASLVGALSLGAAPVAAVADTGIDMLAGQTDQQTWDASTFKWNVTADEYGVYSVEPGDAFVLESVTDVYGNEISTGDYMVVYFNGTGTGATAVAAGGAIDNQDGGMPKSAGSYTAAVVKLDGTAPTITTGTTISSPAVRQPRSRGGRLRADGDPAHGSDYVGQTFTQFFKVVAVQIQANAPYEHGNQADHNLMFTGSALDLDFEISGKELVEGKDYTVKYTKGGKTYDEVVDAGTYTATLTGLGMYAGTSATTAPLHG